MGFGLLSGQFLRARAWSCLSHLLASVRLASLGRHDGEDTAPINVHFNIPAPGVVDPVSLQVNEYGRNHARIVTLGWKSRQNYFYVFVSTILQASYYKCAKQDGSQ